MPKGTKKQAASNENETKSSTQSTTATAHNIAEPPAWLQQLLIMQQTQMEQLQAQAQQVQASLYLVKDWNSQSLKVLPQMSWTE